MIRSLQPSDTVRVKLPEYKNRRFQVLSIYYHLVEIEVGIFIEATLIQKKYKNRYIPITITD